MTPVSKRTPTVPSAAPTAEAARRTRLTQYVGDAPAEPARPRLRVVSRPRQRHRVRHPRAARRRSARGSRGRRRAAADRRRARARARPAPSPIASPISSPSAAWRRRTASPSPSPAGPPPRCASGLQRLLPTSADNVAIHTFHSLGLAILREHASAAGLDHGFRVAGEAERIGAARGDARAQRAQGRAAAARHLPGEAHAELGGRRRRGSDGGLCPRDGAAQLDRLR